MKSSADSNVFHAIGDVAARFGLATHVLRHWEDMGLLSPERDSADRRRYVDDDLVRVAVILRSKAAGMGLDQIAVLLDDQAPRRHEVLEAHLADLERRMAEMERSKEMTAHALRCKHHDITECPRFRTMVDDIVAGTRTWQLTGLDPLPPDRSDAQTGHASRPTRS